MSEFGRCIAKLGLPEHSAVETVNAGLGGSALYRTTLGEVAVVIKHTSACASQLVRDRAEKEYRFYHELASRLPIYVPELLGSFNDEDGHALLMRSYTPLNLKTSTAQQYLQIIGTAASLHAKYWDNQAPALPWLRSNAPELPVDEPYQLWLKLITEHGLDDDGVLSKHTCRALFAALPEIGRMIGSYPTTLCHGDLHAGNILIGAEGEIVVADWQEVIVGAGPADLAFLLQRSEPTGLGLSAAAAIEHYVSCLNQLGVCVTIAEVSEIVNACKLHTMLLFWPDYLVGVPREWVVRIAGDIQSAGVALGLC